jgi:histidine kinase/two component regulator with propeller domain
LLTARGQLLNTFNFNIDNGLPSNHVYGVLCDRHGYLWIATDKGVVKYNGYGFKLFNRSDGISNEDVWEVFEDKKGRVWLANISDEIGYLYNNKYHKAILKGENYTVYPHRISDHNSGIIFYSSHVNGDGKLVICVEKNDTINKYDLDSILNKQQLGVKIPNDDASSIIFNNQTDAIVLYTKFVFKISLAEKSEKTEQLMELPDSMCGKFSNQPSMTFDEYIVSYCDASENPVTLNVINLQKRTSWQIVLKTLRKGDYISRMCLDAANREFYVITDKTILKFKYGDSIQYSGVFDPRSFINNSEVDERKIRTLIRYKLWGCCIGTVTNGILLNYSVSNHFIKEDKLDLKDYKYVGGDGNVSLWWNETNKTITRIGDDLHARRSKFDMRRVFEIIPYSKDSFFLSGTVPYMLDRRTWKLSDPLSDLYGGNIFSTEFERPDSAFIVSGSGCYRAFKSNDHGKFIRHYIDRDRYREVVYDSLRKNCWIYNFDKVIIYEINKNNQITKKRPSDFGVEKFEKIVIDNKFGNIFIEGNSDLTLYDCDQNIHRELYPNVNIKDASVLIYKNVLIVAGRFGIVFSKVLGKMRLSEPIYYPNIKNLNYSYIFSCAAIGKKLLLNTNKGTYSVIIPTDSAFTNAKPDTNLSQYKFIVNYRDSIFDFPSGDTININQKDLRLQFDVLNPFGNGHVKYKYRFEGDSSWHELNSNELTIPSTLTPGNYYVLALKMYDDAWRSENITVSIYIQPFWYQTGTGRQVLWLSAILLMITLLLSAVLITRRIVLNANRKRNMRLELELKSIYAQINPHFIFNTLNSALLLVGKNKTEEAYTHISKFSRLLRAYIKSSRNKLITIADEINNLKDYIELQQTRFKNKFDYQVVVEDDINPKEIMIPSLLLQPFVENAINHGILLKKDTAHLNITFSAPRENTIICVINDDGIGRKISATLNEEKEKKEGSYGDLMIKDLVSIFNKFEEMNIKIEIEDKEEPLTGTIVRILIKNPHHAK